jgi:hypothetical protein
MLLVGLFLVPFMVLALAPVIMVTTASFPGIIAIPGVAAGGIVAPQLSGVSATLFAPSSYAVCGAELLILFLP